MRGCGSATGVASILDPTDLVALGGGWDGAAIQVTKTIIRIGRRQVSWI